MKLLKKSQPLKEAAPAVSLADRIKQTQAEAEAHIQAHVDKLKASDDGKLLPQDWLLLDTRLQHGKNCSCQCALSLIALEKKQ